MKAPSRFTQHALDRFIERWGPLRNAKDALHMATVTGAYHVEDVPDEHQSIWGFVVQSGPRKGEIALMVVSADGTVRTVLPPGSKKPANRKRRSR